MTPLAPQRPCTQPGCARLTSAGRCDDHKRRRESAAKRGYGAKWRRLRAYVLRNEPLCRHCKRAPATDVDHIVPRAKGGTDAMTNLQPLCKSCHSRKTATEDGRWG